MNTFRKVNLGDKVVHGPQNFIVGARYAVSVDGEEVGHVDKLVRMWFHISPRRGGPISHEVWWAAVNADGSHEIMHRTRKNAAANLRVVRQYETEARR